MRILISTALALSISGSLFAQEWIEFASREDRFTCNFPSQPKVTEITYRSQHEADLPARVYSASQGQILTEKAKSCPAGAEPCLGGPGDEGHWKADVRGAMSYAAWQLMQRDARLTLFVWGVVDQVEGNQLQLTNNTDKSRTFAGIYMHENKLYIIEGTVPPGYPEPGFFQQSLGWLDENGVGLRYQSYYSNGFPAPPRVNRAGRGQGQNRIDAPGADGGRGSPPR